MQWQPISYVYSNNLCHSLTNPFIYCQLAIVNRPSIFWCNFQTLQKDRRELALKLEADRMANLVLSADEFAKEINVVMEERRMRTEDNPQGKLYEALMATAYQSHPYRHPVIGWMDDL